MFDPEKIKQDFPIFEREVGGKPLVYLDSAATAHKPRVVIEALVDYYGKHNANVHRGIHTLADDSTRMYQTARSEVAKFVGGRESELVFVGNTTEAINLVRFAWVRDNLGKGEVVVASELDHHSNLVVWQEACKEAGAGLTFVEATAEGKVDVGHLEAILQSLGDRVRLVALPWVSNVTGAVLELERVVGMRDKLARGAKILVDGAQAVAQMRVDFGGSGIDFLAFSGHKLYGPMGIGGLVVRRDILENMRPFMVGGGMIEEVRLFGSRYVGWTDRFDAGTPNVAGAVGLAAAVGYLDKLGMDEVMRHSEGLVEYAVERLSGLGFVRVIGPVKKGLDARKSKVESGKFSVMPERLGSVAFVVKGVHAHDVAQILDSVGVAVRSGHHCAMPLHRKWGLAATTRASFGVYNSESDVDRMVEGLLRVKEVFEG